MSTLVSDNLFLLLLIFGGVLVCTRGHELYSTPSPRSDAQWLLDEMNLIYMTGNRKFATGFAFYMVPVLFFYVLLSVSPEILNLSMGIAGTTNSVGALTLTGSDLHTYAPLLAATAVITLLNVKPFSSFEHAIRRVSHEIAGIPHHVQDIVRKIRELPFQTPTEANSLSELQLDHFMRIPGLRNDLLAIEQLDEWIFGHTGLQLWSDKAMRASQPTRQRIKSECYDLKRKLKSDYSSIDDNNSVKQDLRYEALEKVVRQSRDLRIQLTRLLAILIANQDERLPKHIASKDLWDLVSLAQRKRNSSRHIDILATSTLVGIVISVLLATVFNFVVIIVCDMSMQNASLDFTYDVLYIAGRNLGEFYWLSLHYSARAAWWDVIGTGLIFYTGCATALIYRAARVNSARWESLSRDQREPWEFRSHPVFQYLTIALLASVTAGLFYELFLFVKLVILPSVEVRNAEHFASMLKDFGSDYVAYGLLALLTAPSAVMVCRLSDDFDFYQENKNLLRNTWVPEHFWSVGLITTILYFIVRLMIGENFVLSDLVVTLVVPSGTLLIMSVAFWQIGISTTETEASIEEPGSPPTLRPDPNVLPGPHRETIARDQLPV